MKTLVHPQLRYASVFYIILTSVQIHIESVQHRGIARRLRLETGEYIYDEFEQLLKLNRKTPQKH